MMDIEQALDYFLTAKKCAKSPRTVRWYQDCLRHLIDFLPEGTQVEAITTHDLRLWLSQPDLRFLSPWTVNAYGRSTKHFFSWLTAEEILEKNPARRLEVFPLPKTPRVGINNKDRDAMLEAVRESPRDYALLRFAAATGARISGIAGLRIEDLELDGRRAYVHEKGRGGNHKCRAVFFDQTTADAIAAWLKIRPDKCNDLVFGLTHSGVYQVFKRVAKQLRLKPGWYPHNWRHAFARHFLRNGGDISILSQIMGHSDIRVTKDHYGDLDDDDLQRLYNRYAPFP